MEHFLFLRLKPVNEMKKEKKNNSHKLSLKGKFGKDLRSLAFISVGCVTGGCAW